MSDESKPLSLSDLIAILTVCGFIIAGVVFVLRLETRIVVMEAAEKARSEEQSFLHGDVRRYMKDPQ